MKPNVLLAAGLALTVVVGPGCVMSRSRVSPLGRKVTLVPRADGEKVTGELLVVGEDRVWVRSKDAVREVPLDSVRQVRVRRHGLTGRKSMGWTTLGGMISSGLLTISCARAKANGCGNFGLRVGGIWLVVGGLAARSNESSSQVSIDPQQVDRLRPFARLPQGPPEGLDLLSLAGLRSNAPGEPEAP